MICVQHGPMHVCYLTLQSFPHQRWFIYLLFALFYAANYTIFWYFRGKSASPSQDGRTQAWCQSDCLPTPLPLCTEPPVNVQRLSFSLLCLSPSHIVYVQLHRSQMHTGKITLITHFFFIVPTIYLICACQYARDFTHFFRRNKFCDK